jgi:hypothetical protein
VSRIELPRVLLARGGASAQREVEELLALAEALAATPGDPRIYLAHILELRAVQGLSAEKGADGHAARLARELGA